METQTSQTEEQLALLDHRLTAVERNLGDLTSQVVALNTEVAVLSKTVSTKEDMARIDAKLTALQENSATKADVLAGEVRIMKWMVATLIGAVAVSSSMALFLAKFMQL